MATYTKVYNNPYPDGWQDGKDGNTPVTASILNNQTETLESIEQYLEDNPITQGGGSGETGTTDYNDLTNKPSINGTELSGDITLDIPEKISDLEDDSEFLTDIKEQPYSDLSGKPTINGVEVVGDLTAEDLNLSGGGGGGTTDYEELDNLPSIENVELKGNVTLAELGTKKQIRISWADYQALSTEEKNDLSVVYYVYDYPGNVILASNVVYDGTESGVEATEVQGAIDNLYATRSLKTYTSLAQLGMSTDNTITEVMTALPIVSEIVFNTAQIVSNLTDGLPNGAEAGTLRFTKGGNNARGILTFESYSSDAVYKNRYYNSAFVGWRKLTEENDIDAITSVRNLKTYTNVTQLGLTQDNTLDEIFNALPVGGQLVMATSGGKDLGGSLPNDYTAQIVITKAGSARGTVMWTRYSTGTTAINALNNSVWTGWKIFATESQ